MEAERRMFIDAHTHRLLAEERAAELRRSMGAQEARGEAWLPRVLATFRYSIADHRTREIRRRAAATGLPR
jgi:imidazolonepropionase-like amidohydrolase